MRCGLRIRLRLRFDAVDARLFGASNAQSLPATPRAFEPFDGYLNRSRDREEPGRRFRSREKDGTSPLDSFTYGTKIRIEERDVGASGYSLISGWHPRELPGAIGAVIDLPDLRERLVYPMENTRLISK